MMMIVSALMDESRGGAVDFDLSRAALAGNRVGLKPRAVVDVDDGNHLVRENVGGFE
jgi:hypothetical protein